MYTPSERTQKQIDNNFVYHKPVDGQVERYGDIRHSFGVLAMILAANCPESRELSVALTKMEEAVMWANAAIARNEKGEQ